LHNNKIHKCFSYKFRIFSLFKKTKTNKSQVSCRKKRDSLRQLHLLIHSRTRLSLFVHYLSLSLSLSHINSLSHIRMQTESSLTKIKIKKQQNSNKTKWTKIA